MRTENRQDRRAVCAENRQLCIITDAQEYAPGRIGGNDDGVLQIAVDPEERARSDEAEKLLDLINACALLPGTDWVTVVDEDLARLNMVETVSPAPSPLKQQILVVDTTERPKPTIVLYDNVSEDEYSEHETEKTNISQALQVVARELPRVKRAAELTEGRDAEVTFKAALTRCVDGCRADVSIVANTMVDDRFILIPRNRDVFEKPLAAKFKRDKTCVLQFSWKSPALSPKLGAVEWRHQVERMFHYRYYDLTSPRCQKVVFINIKHLEHLGVQLGQRQGDGVCQVDLVTISAKRRKLTQAELHLENRLMVLGGSKGEASADALISTPASKWR